MSTLKKHTSLDEIIGQLKERSMKFNESIDLDIQTGIDSTKQDQNMRGTILLKHGISSPVKILVFAEGENARIAKEAGATTVGFNDLIEKIKSKSNLDGSMALSDYNICLTTNDLMMKLKDVANILGRSGLMPNKKDGTITDDLQTTITTLKSGSQVLFRNDKSGYIRMRIAKSDFTNDKIVDNIKTIVDQLQLLKPAKLKQLFKRFIISSTQGSGLNIPLKLIYN